MDAAEVIESNDKTSKEDKAEEGFPKNQDVLALNVNLIPSKLPQPTHQQPNKETIKSAEADFVKTILEWNEKQVDKPDEGSVEEKEEEEESEKEEPKTCHMVFEVGIQANDYDIERRSGRVPSRKRIIPFKFRDYRNPENVEKDKSDSDSDFDYQLPVPKSFVKVKRRPGRPKKEIIPTIIEVPSTSAVTTETNEPGTAVASSTVVSETNQAAATFQSIVKVNGNKTVAYACDLCNRVFLQKGNLKVHRRLHTDERPFPCDFGNCDKKFRSNETLRRHKLTHTGEKPFTCVTCNNKFSSKVSLTEHQAIHDNTKNYKCDKCGRSFRQVSCFKRHQVTHTLATPYICDVCGKSFSQMAYLRSHSKIHSGLRPFSCDTCKKTFANKSDLTRHKIIHSGIKPYKCTHCNHQFSDASSCRRHIREHSQAKPYICYKCGEGFKRTGQLKVHIARRHANKDEQDLVKKEPIDVDAIVHIKDQEQSVLNLDSNDSHRKIVSLIKNLNSNIVVQQVEIASPDKSKNQLSETVYVEEVNVASVTDNDLIQLSQAVENSTNQLEIPLQEVPGRQDTEKTVLAITDSENGGNYETYQIIQGLSENSNEQQVFEVRYQDNEEPSKPDTPLADPETARDYVANPDFGSQEYYNWLSNFTELCKMVPMPLDVSLFQKMSQVHKTLSDVMATPTGVVADKENYRVLMTISRDLNMIISEHLNFVLQNLADDQMPS